MNARVSRATIILSIVWKDLREFSRDRTWMIMAPLSLAMVIAMFWILPGKLNETISVGLHMPGLGSAAGALSALGATRDLAAKGVKIVAFDTEERLRDAVTGRLEDETAEEVAVGIAVPADFISAAWTGKRTEVRVYIDAAVPDEMRLAATSAIREVAYALRALAAGRNPIDALPVKIPDPKTIILGEDHFGEQVPFRERLRPMLAFTVLLIEALALAGLIAVEIQRRTVTAILVTPASVGDVLAAKWIVGTVLGLSQVIVFLLATKSFGPNWLLVTALMFLGAVMMSAVGMIAGASGRDFINTLLYAMILIVPLIIPAFAAIIRGSTSLWVKALPSYGLVEALEGAVAYGRGWSDLGHLVALTFAWDVLLFGLGLIVLKKKVETL